VHKTSTFLWQAPVLPSYLTAPAPKQPLGRQHLRAEAALAAQQAAPLVRQSAAAAAAQSGANLFGGAFSGVGVFGASAAGQLPASRFQHPTAAPAGLAVINQQLASQVSCWN